MATTSLSRTMTAGDRDKFTVSAWVKRGRLDSDNVVVQNALWFGDGDSGFAESSDDSIRVYTAGNHKWNFISDYFSANDTGAPRIVAGAGSAGAPVYGFNDDPNTGMYRTGADAIGFSTAGSLRMTVSSSGEVGIGTTAPNGILHLQDSSGTAYLRMDSRVTDSSEGWYFKTSGTVSTTTLEIGSRWGSDTPRLQLHGTSISGSASSTGSFGKVGVGVAATAINNNTQLAVNGNMYLGGSGTANPANTLHVQGTGITMSDGDRDRTSMHQLAAASDKGGIYFKCRLSSSPTEHFRIDYDGTLTATDTTIASNSDIRTKKEIANYTGPITGSMSGSTSLELIDSLTIKKWNHCSPIGQL